MTDSSGSGNTATAAPGVTWSGSGAVLPGQDGQDITTSRPVVDTTGSFSVSAWVNMAASTGNNQAIVSQDGNSIGGYCLCFDIGSGKWDFTRPEQDSNSPSAYATAWSPGSAQTGTWTLLTGVFNAGTGAVQLYVNGSDSGTDATDPSPIAAAGPLEIGGVKWAGQAGGGGFDGTIANVQVYPAALSAAQVASLYQLGRTGGPVTRGALTTSYQVDQLGQVTAQTNPDGATTSYAYDEAGQRAVLTGPPVAAETGGGTPVTVRAVTTTGYNTFGEVTETQDPNGNVTTSVYDADGRPVSKALPPYTPPGASSPVPGTSTTTYNTLGEVTASTDPLGNATTYAYDQLGRRTGQTDPDNGVTTTSYDAAGEVLSQTGPTGAQATGTYDYLGRQVTATSVERYPSPASYTTTTSYAATSADPSGTWKSLVTSPDGVTTGYGYDAAGETTQVTDAAGNLTKFTFDALGRQTAAVNPDGTTGTVSYDPAGNQLAQASLDAAGHTLASTSATYNGEGQQLSATDALGNASTFTYDPTGLLTQEIQPVSATSGITTSFGYDAAGNQTRYTDGNGGKWVTTYNSWNLPQTQVEPATSTYTTVASSTTTIAYNGDRQPVTVTAPGGVTVTDTYNSMGDLAGQSGTGASAPTASRSFSYDTAGDILTAATTSTAGSGQPSNATSEAFSYNDRGLPLTATGSAGSTSYTWNGDGQQASVQDGAGTASYTYDSAGRLRTMADPASGATLTYSYSPMSQVSGISYGGAGTSTRALGYDSLHRLTSDTLTNGTATVASISYGYNADGNLTSKVTTGLAGAGTSSYGYDQAGRLTSWNNGTTTTTYGYDGAGNRIQAGTTSYTFDARDQLTSDGTSTYAYTANGDLATVTGPSGTTASTSDAYGQQGAQGTQGNAYDALGRDVQLTAGSTVTTFSYQGTTGQLAGDGTSAYTYTPAGTLAGTAPAGNPGHGVLDLTDRHTDLVAQFTPAGTTLTGSRAYGPWGATAASGGTLTGALGYQSQYTSPATGQVNMGARWYNPATGSFGNKDTVANRPVPDSASASPFGYAADNPLDGTDPTGHRPLADPGTSNAVTAQILKAFATKSLPAQLAAAAAHRAAAAKAAQQAAAARAAAPKISTYCAGNLMDGPDTHACSGAVYRAAGGQYTNGVPNWKGYDPAVADQAMGIVRQHYNAVQDATQKRDASTARQRDANAARGKAGTSLPACTTGGGSRFNDFGACSTAPMPTGGGGMPSWFKTGLKTAGSFVVHHWQQELEVAGLGVCIFASAGACLIASGVYTLASYGAAVVDAHGNFLDKGALEGAGENLVAMFIMGYAGKVVGGFLASTSAEEVTQAFNPKNGLWSLPYLDTNIGMKAIIKPDYVSTAHQLLNNAFWSAAGCYGSFSWPCSSS